VEEVNPFKDRGNGNAIPRCWASDFACPQWVKMAKEVFNGDGWAGKKFLHF